MHRFAIIGIYLLLLLASTWVRRAQAPFGPLAAGQKLTRLPEFAQGQPSGRTIEIAFWDVPATSGELRTPIVVLHGSPVATSAMQPLLDALRGGARLIAPDFPGLGASRRQVADYSFDAHARSVLALLDQLEIDRAHLVAYSMGGGVALEIAARAPERVASVALISSVGVQELELLGDYRLNHTLHGLQFAALWFLQNLTPHFGLLDRFPLNTSYARNFLDSDQRPLRQHLERVAAPMLIVHGTDDHLVPTAAAREHARIVPQSELVLAPGGHLLVITEATKVAAPLREFLRRVEQGSAKTLVNADAERIAAATQAFDWRVHGLRGPGYQTGAAVFLGAATLGSEDLACLSGGLLVARGALSFTAATAGCLGGIVVGDVLLFLAGRFLGKRALRRRPFRWFLKPDRVERCAVMFRQRGAVLVLAARFLPGLRLPTYFAAGAAGMKLRIFLGYFLVAALLWTPLLVGAAALVGDPILGWAAAAGRWSWLVAILGLAGTWATARVASLALSRRGRRLLVGWWRRRTRWEFWPAWAVYPPVMAYLLWLALRHRGLTVFTAANPSIPCGGLAGESKSDILRGFPADRPEIARFTLLAPASETETRLAALDDFMRENALAFPIVLKPDVGERGQGVAVVRDRVAAADYLRRCDQPVIAQEYVDGREFGLFYACRPSEHRGRIISITAKHLTSVRGDGCSTLEELILADERAVCSAPFFLRRLAARLGEVPAKGTDVRLTELGTHCRGARFTDGWSEAWSETLVERLDVLSRSMAGFHFGRYDVRAPSAEALRERGEFKVLELNGVGSESTHIYDPRNTLWDGWRALCAQWRLAYAIGAENRARGARPASVREVVRALNQHLSRPRFEA